jgi:asparagine synthase (glutamine-hydrolysing)
VEQFLSPDAKRHAEHTGISHFLATLGQGTLGQVYHEEMLARLTPYVHDTPDSAGPPMVAPLVSQPIMETCLSIPSWDWVQGGRNRSVARHVAARRLPEMIAARQAKGGPDVLSAQLCRHHRRLLAERLLDGRLAAARTLDREAVERALTETSLMTTGRQREILMLFEAELWMEHWITRAHGRALSSFA